MRGVAGLVQAEPGNLPHCRADLLHLETSQTGVDGGCLLHAHCDGGTVRQAAYFIDNAAAGDRFAARLQGLAATPWNISTKSDSTAL